jgi:hypothetical protein
MPYKPLSLAGCCLLLALAGNAQTNNPYQSIGKKAATQTLTNGQSHEFFDEDSIQRIGSTLMNIHTGEIVQLQLSKEEVQQADNSKAGRFLSVDPLARNYAMLTPYQYASNRPIDGLDVDGMEYMTFNVTVSKDADGHAHYGVCIAEDFRGKTGEEMAQIHGRGKAYARNFYSNYSESFGPKGRGFLFNYFDEKGNQIGQPVWQMKQSKILNFKNSGYYSGSGSITSAGPGIQGDNATQYFNNQYDWGYTPMNYSDKISKDHDRSQEIEIVQSQGWLEDTRTLKTDYVLLQAATDGVKNRSLLNSKEDLQRAKNIKLFFTQVIIYKEWKQRELQKRGYNPEAMENQKILILKDWHPSIFQPRQLLAKIILTLSGGGAKDHEIKPKEPKNAEDKPIKE